MDEAAAVAKLRKRIEEEWLPAFCNDPKRRIDPAGFRASSIQVNSIDARDCMFAIDSGIVVDGGGGRYRAARNATFEQLFWTGRRNQSPRPLTLWLEPVITFAALARLHRDHHWPTELLGSQAKGWAFDIVAHMPSDERRYQIAGEVKKSNQEVDRLLADLVNLSTGVTGVAVKENSRRKWEALLIGKPPILWIVGPAGYSTVMRVAYPSEDQAALESVTPSALDFDRF